MSKRRFQNNYTPFEPKSLADLLRWRFDALRHGKPAPPTEAIPRIEPDLAFIGANCGKDGTAQVPAVTWVGHATVLAQLGGISLLTDPMFSERASPFGFAGPKRHQPPGLSLAQLPQIDLVVVSHNHYDHLDEASVRALGAQAGGAPLFVVPLGLADWCRRRGIERVVELDWWQSHRLGAVEVMLVPAQHWSARGIGDAMATLWGGFAVLAPDCQLFFAGDTGYSRDFVDIRTRLAGRQMPESEGGGGGFDIALLPIGAYEPRWFMQTQHVNVEEAIKIHRDLGAKRSLGMHWGTFALTDEPLDEPPRELARQCAALGIPAEAFATLAIGATWRLPPRPASAAARAA